MFSRTAKHTHTRVPFVKKDYSALLCGVLALYMSAALRQVLILGVSLFMVWVAAAALQLVAPCSELCNA